MDVFDVMYSMRAMRRLKADPVPEALIWKLVEAGTKAPSGGDSQPWRFLVVQDAELKRFIQERYRRAMTVYLRAGAARRAAAASTTEGGEAASATADVASAATNAAPADSATLSPAAARRARMAQAAEYLADHLHEAPVLLFVCLMPRRDLPTFGDRARPGAAIYSSIFPAVQNVLLACRALGLGTTLTTLHLVYEAEIKERLGIPAEVETVALLPIGYPVGRFGPTTRAPAEDVTYWDGWNQLRARR